MASKAKQNTLEAIRVSKSAELSLKAWRVIDECMGSDNPPDIRLKAATKALEYAHGKPRQQTNVTHDVTSNAAAQLAALAAKDVTLLPTVPLVPIQNAKSLINHDNKETRGYLPINNAPLIEHEAQPDRRNSDDISMT